MTSPPPSTRSLWVWRTSDPVELAELSIARGVDRWFVAVDRRSVSDPACRPKEIVAAALAHGIAADALGGDPGWIDHPARAVTWLHDALATGWFARVHLDIEPHAHPGWVTDRDRIVDGYLSLLDLIERASDVPVELDLAHWYHEVTVDGGRLDEAALGRVDAVTVLAYRNLATGPDGTLAIAAATVGAAIAQAVPFRIGQETNALGDDATSRKQTFYGQPLATMDRALAVIDVGFCASDGFAGIAVHDAVGYASMR